jgi:acyl-CoA reductase-like NAD-dependent aldehyde dehydrogenase
MAKANGGGATAKRLAVKKTYKLFIGGAFPRTEGGRTVAVADQRGAIVARAARATRKDLRDAVQAARGAFPGWSGRTAFNRGQILYRLAEMMELRERELAAEIARALGVPARAAEGEVTAAVDRTVWYAGWCDKYTQLFSSVNPVAGPYFDFTVPEPCGVVAIVAPPLPSLLGLVSTVLPALVSGNTVVAVASDRDPLSAVALAECVATSDLPGGAFNLLTGRRDDLLPHLARHMDVNAIDAYGIEADAARELAAEGAESVKRVHAHPPADSAFWFGGEAQSPYWIERLTEAKTAWHPIGW